MVCCLPAKTPVETEKAVTLLTSVNLLKSLEKRFSSMDKNGDSSLTAAEIVEAWQDASFEVWGKVNQADAQLIMEEAKRIIARIDLNGDGVVSFDEFAHFMLMRASLPRQLTVFNDVVRERTKSDPLLLQRLIAAFREADVGATGEIPIATLHKILEEIIPNSHASKVAVKMTGSIKYGEYMMLMLGRKPHPVKLLQYDISDKATKTLARLLFGRPIEGIWHTSVVVFNKEWWFGGRVFRSEIYSTPFGKPVKEIELPATFLKHSELFAYLTETVADKYTAESYDVIKCNCNHFSNDVVKYLTGTGIPKDILEMPEKLLSGGVAYLVRPFLNSWLGGFKRDDVHAGETDETDRLMLSVTLGLIKKGKVAAGGLVEWMTGKGEHTIAQIVNINMDSKTATIRYLHQGKFVELPKVPLSKLRTISENAVTDKHAVFSTLASVDNEPYRQAVERSLRKNPTLPVQSIRGSLFMNYLSADPNKSVIVPLKSQSSTCCCTSSKHDS